MNDGTPDLPPMPMRALGRTGLRVSRLGLGLAALGRPGYMTIGHADDVGPDKSREAMEARCHAMLDRAVAAGIRYVDAARSYGLAEDFLASWLPRCPEARVPVIGSKWGYAYTAGFRAEAMVHEVKEHSLERLEMQWAETEARLGRNVALYQIHSATLESGVLDDARVLDRLASIRDRGVAIGLSVTGPRQGDTVAKAIDVERGGRPLFDCVQATFNALEPSVGPMLARAHAAGLGVVVKEGVANGRLSPKADLVAIAPLATEAKRLGVGIDALSLAWILSHPFVDVALSGAATPAQLDANLRALAVEPGAIDRERLAPLAEAPERYWGFRGTLAWN